MKSQTNVNIVETFTSRRLWFSWSPDQSELAVLGLCRISVWSCMWTDVDISEVYTTTATN